MTKSERTVPHLHVRDALLMEITIVIDLFMIIQHAVRLHCSTSVFVHIHIHVHSLQCYVVHSCLNLPCDLFYHELHLSNVFFIAIVKIIGCVLS